MKIANVVIRPFDEGDTDAVIALWRRCDLVVPWNDPRHDIDCKLAVQRDLFLVAVDDGQIIGTVMAGYDGHRGWVNYLATDPNRRALGIGRTLMQAIEDALRARGCPKINLQVRRWNSNAIGFYETVGYVVDDVVSMGKRL